jgi:hypothetical protein
VQVGQVGLPKELVDLMQVVADHQLYRAEELQHVPLLVVAVVDMAHLPVHQVDLVVAVVHQAWVELELQVREAMEALAQRAIQRIG